jgi:hypothetical protein
VRVGIAAFSVTLSTERRLSRTSASALGAALQWSQRGLLLKLRISRHSHRLVVPLYLAATPSPTDLLLGCGVPSLLLAVARRGIVRPLRRRAKEHSLRRGREDEAAAREAAAAARRAAFAEARLLTREAASRAREEAIRGGHVILGAVYGDVEAALQAAETTGVGRYTPSGTASTAAGGGGTRSEHETDEAANGGAAAAEEGEDGWLADSLGRRWLDVRVPLQFAVSEGVLRTYLLDAYSGCRLKLPTTGNAGGVRNLSINMGELDRSGMLALMGTGLFVTELMGHGVNAVTGDYSRGAAGFWVEHGEIQFPVEEITIAGNLKEMFAGLVAVGNDCDFPGSTRTGSWLIGEMTIAGE